MARVMLSVPDGLLKKVDEWAKAEHMKRSELFREALRGWLAAHGHVTIAESIVATRLRALEEMRKFREAHPPVPGAPDSVDLIRQMRGPLT